MNSVDSTPAAPSGTAEQIYSREAKSPAHERAAFAIALALVPLLFFYPAVTGRITLLPGDGWSQIFGIRVLIGQMIAAGTVPLWNPFIFGGMPLLASIQPGALYPPSWLFAVLSPAAAMNVMVILTYHIALIGGYRFARALGLIRLAALATGIIFAFSGFMLAHLGHTNRVAAAAWMPWILLAVERLYQHASWRYVTLGAIFLLLQNLAGDPQMTFYTLLLVAAWALFSLTLREERERRFRVIIYGASMALCGALLSAIQLLPARELLRQGERAGITYEYFSTFSLPPLHLLGLVFPYFFGGAAIPPYLINYWGRWNLTETCGYVGLAGLTLAFIAISARGGRQERRVVWFWTGAAVIAMLLAFGDNLPFGINQLLHSLPVYNLFRASGRHLLEFSLAVALLAGLGLQGLTQMERRPALRRLLWATLIMSVVVTGTAITYRFMQGQMTAWLPRGPGSADLTNPEAIIPISLFVISTLALWHHTRRRSGLSGALVAAVLLADMASFGWFYEWQWQTFDVSARMSDPPAVQFIKGREQDLNTFRIISHAAEPFTDNYRENNYPNVSIVRGLQSVNGYDPVRLERMARLAGEMTLDGIVVDPGVYSPEAQGLNLLNVKYLLRTRAMAAAELSIPAAEKLRFSAAPLGPMLAPGRRAELQANSTPATELALISAMGNAVHLTDDTPAVRIRLHTTDGKVIEREMQVGRDTAEWAYDRPDTSAAVRHQRALVAESWDAGGFEGHRYLARLSFERAAIDYIELDYLPVSGDLRINQLSLYDAQTGTSTPLGSLRLAPERWRRLATFDEVDVYENLHALPRAWFVQRVEALTSEQVLRTIRTGLMPDGRPFDPAQTALFETEDFGGRTISLPETGRNSDAELSITGYEAHRIRLKARNQEPGFLVLSEIYYRGWEARIDGQRVPVERVNHTLRGIAVPPGEHQIEFHFRSPSFRSGIVYALIGALLLIVGALAGRVRRRGFTLSSR